MTEPLPTSGDLHVLPNRDQQIVHALPQGREAGRAIVDPVLEDLRWRNLMRAAVTGDPRAQWDLGVEAMKRIVGEKE